MEAAIKRQRTQSRKESPRLGDWVCVYCNNYNYAFRTTCNRCRLQTRTQNDEATALLAQQASGQAQNAGDWVLASNIENEDPIRDSWFPKVLFVTPPKAYAARRTSLNRERWPSLNREVAGLAQTDPNLSKKHLRFKQQAIQKENLRWLNKIIEQ